MNLTVGELISQIRSLTKSSRNTNLYISDRLIWSLFKKHATTILYTEDSKMKVFKMDYIFSVAPFLELEEVDKVDKNCFGVSAGCKIKRTKKILPNIFKGYWGPLIRDVTSIDGEIKLMPTTLAQFNRKEKSPNFKYNKSKYYWESNGRLYFPNIEWDAVRAEAAFEEEPDCEELDGCISPQDKRLFIPEYMISSIQGMVLQELGLSMQILKNPEQDKNLPI
jgi:hypothetical protein